MPISPTLITAAQRGQIVILAGAGVSAGWPSALPSWKPLNRAITDALRQRLEAGLQRPDWLAADRFPAFASHAFEAAWQIRRMLGDPDADKALRVAVQAADDSGLAARRDWLQRFLG